MTITTRCTNKAVKCHQEQFTLTKLHDLRLFLINNKTIYKILKNYYKISKIQNLINTSFNVHEEPIVCSPHDAVKAFLEQIRCYLSANL